MLLKNYGVRESCFGVKIGDLKQIQKRIQKDYQLALDLDATGNDDAMIDRHGVPASLFQSIHA